ncbi:hypothetical protein EV193_102300 [Herbihabitans rhizosphaerae]|uniref:Glycerophosphoryl diester phosphodiesterase family protein n=1 Tax=Herbihabitans rhizosphaerae TaxID=1872711 RepID=A0A4Q7L4A5_9PSEU|nr:DUF6159 family protein [Herbihabitans rhizosphaerae]RZS43321.1 hypothetical protein EV193_102300 [Herbihabitans rhizosphaerae]
MGRFARSWQLFKASWAVLRSRKELAVFPVLSGVASVVVAVAFLAPAAAVSWSEMDNNGGVKPLSYVLLGLFYLVSAYVTIFFNAALISQANIALSGGDPSVKGGLKVAGENWLRILPWAVISATVSVILRAIEERLGFLGRFIVGLVGLAWQLVTFLVLPVLVLERVGVKQGLSRSAEMFKGTWGENVVGNAGLGILGFLLTLPGVALIALGVSAGGATALACLIVAVVWFLVVAIVMTALTGIYQTALYRFAADGATPPAFEQADLSHMFASKR